MLRIAKRARCGALAVCGGLLLAGCTDSARSYTIQSAGTGSNWPDHPDNIGPPIPVILPPAPPIPAPPVLPALGGNDGNEARQVLPRRRAIIPSAQAAEPVRAAAKPPLDPPPLIDPPAATSACVGWWRSCHFL